MGCGGSKPTAAAPAAAQPAQENLLNKQEEPKPAEASAAAAAPAKLALQVASAHGLRPADLAGNKSDVFVEVFIEGKPDSKITSSTVTGKAAALPGAAAGAKDSVQVELNFSGELTNYVAGDKIVFLVKDKDLLGTDFLGRAEVTDGAFGGRLELEGAGEGYSAFLLVQLGGGAGLTEALASLQKTMADAQAKLSAAATLAASGDPDKMVEAAAASGAALKAAAVEVKETIVMEVESRTNCSACC